MPAGSASRLDQKMLHAIIRGVHFVTPDFQTAPGDLPGNLFVFDQPLLNSRYEPIGTNSGYCIRTLPGKHSQCLWTLTLANGTITVAGSEADAGTSLIPVIGGTGAYLTAGGMLATTPNGDRTYTQVLTLLLHATASAREP